MFQRAWILLLADKGMKDEEISDFIKVSPRTVERTRGMRLLRGVIDEVSTEIRILLKKHDLKPWKKKQEHQS
ncbi:MAG: helix-turn-helix domain-containing protein [Archaeoglobaceae archaeon]